MAGYLSNLVFNVTSGTTSAVVSTGVGLGLKYMNQALTGGAKKENARFYYRYGDGGIMNVLARKIAGGAIAYAEKQGLNQLKAWLTKKNSPLAKRTSQIQSLSDKANQEDTGSKKYGIMYVNDRKNAVLALDFVGNWCPDAVMLGIPVEPGVQVSQRYVGNDQLSSQYRLDKLNSFNSDTLVWYDVTALITVQNERKLIVTPVTGRDYSRKELMSNGDITFTITGRINSNLPDVYPTSEVQKFIQIMQYRGPVRINSQFLSQYNIEKMVITGYSLPQKEGYRNIQEYTINCVGVQPVMDVKVTEDTIISLNRVISVEVSKKETKWSKLLKDTVEGLKTTSLDALDTASTSGNAWLINQI